MRQLPQPKFQAAVAAGDARAAAVAAVQALEVAVTAAMANIERASAGQGAECRRENLTQRRLKSPLHLGSKPSVFAAEDFLCLCRNRLFALKEDCPHSLPEACGSFVQATRAAHGPTGRMCTSRCYQCCRRTHPPTKLQSPPSSGVHPARTATSLQISSFGAGSGICLRSGAAHLNGMQICNVSAGPAP